jgi:hypothetical protein
VIARSFLLKLLLWVLRIAAGLIAAVGGAAALDAFRHQFVWGVGWCLLIAGLMSLTIFVIDQIEVPQ